MSVDGMRTAYPFLNIVCAWVSEWLGIDYGWEGFGGSGGSVTSSEVLVTVISTVY